MTKEDTGNVTAFNKASYIPSKKRGKNYDLDQELYYFNGEEPFTTRQACEGVQIFGGVGAGKTSGSGAALAQAYLRAGFGGLVLSAKQTVLDDWLAYAKATGREKDVIVFDVSGDYCFPFLQYEVQREGAGAGMTENILRIFTAVFNAINRTDSSKSNDQYWVRSMQQLLRNVVDLCLIVKEEVSIPLIHKVVMSAPNSMDERNTQEWQDSSLCFQLLLEGNHKPIDDKWGLEDLRSTSSYLLNEFPKLGPRTRSSIVSTLTSMLDGLNRRPFRMLFSEAPEDSKKILYPELSHEGKIIILNIPVKEFGETGRSAQIIYKYLWQQATERRDITLNNRPVFLWADEAQYFATQYDMEFQTTARSSRACTVYITQNLPNYYSQMGGNFVDSLVNNLQTKIWHANSDPQTNKNASEIIGQSWQKVSSLNYDMGPALDKRPLSQTVMDSYQYDVGHKHFTSLLKGAPENDYIVEAFIFQNGRTWDEGESYLKASFDQRDYTNQKDGS